MASAEARLNALVQELDYPEEAILTTREDGRAITIHYIPGWMVTARILMPPRDKYIQVDAFGLNPLTERGHINYVEDRKLPGIIKTLLED